MLHDVFQTVLTSQLRRWALNIRKETLLLSGPMEVVLTPRLDHLAYLDHAYLAL